MGTDGNQPCLTCSRDRIARHSSSLFWTVGAGAFVSADILVVFVGRVKWRTGTKRAARAMGLRAIWWKERENMQVDRDQPRFIPHKRGAKEETIGTGQTRSVGV